MFFPRAQPLQAASIYTQPTTAQQTGGIDISTLMNLMLPVMVIGCSFIPLALSWTMGSVFLTHFNY
jgi:hypothetical protein